MDASTAALIGAGIGVVGGGAFGFLSASGVSRWLRAAVREARIHDRRATTYLEVTASWTRHMQNVIQMARDDGPAPTEALLSLDDVLSTRPRLSMFGSKAVLESLNNPRMDRFFMPGKAPHLSRYLASCSL